MTLPRNITFVVRGNCLTPYGEADRQLFADQYGDGEIVETQVPPLHKKFYAILTRVLRENEALPWESAEELADALKRAAGAVYACESLAGKSYLATLSVSSIRDFPAFFDKAMQALADYLGMLVEDLVADPKVEEKQESALKEMRDRAPEPLAWEYSRTGCVEKMLALAANKDFPPTAENREKLEDIVAMWRGYIGDFADRAGQVCWDILVKNISHAAGKKLLDAMVKKS